MKVFLIFFFFSVQFEVESKLKRSWNVNLCFVFRGTSENLFQLLLWSFLFINTPFAWLLLWLNASWIELERVKRASDRRLIDGAMHFDYIWLDWVTVSRCSNKAGQIFAKQSSWEMKLAISKWGLSLGLFARHSRWCRLSSWVSVPLSSLLGLRLGNAYQISPKAIMQTVRLQRSLWYEMSENKIAFSCFLAFSTAQGLPCVGVGVLCVFCCGCRVLCWPLSETCNIKKRINIFCHRLTHKICRKSSKSSSLLHHVSFAYFFSFSFFFGFVFGFCLQLA